MTIMLVIILITSAIATLGTTAKTNKDENYTPLFGGGDGSITNPYLIENVHDLQNMSKELDAHYALADNINASYTKNWNDGKGFDPVGNDSNKFTGSLKGEGYKITNLHIDRPDSGYVALFGYLDSTAEITNVAIENVNVTGWHKVAGLVGWNKGIVKNSYVTGNVSSVTESGLLIGINPDGNVEDCYVDGNITGDRSEIGGLMGANWVGKVINSHYNISSVSINNDNIVTIGGLFENQYSDWIKDKNLDISDYYNTLKPVNNCYEINDVQGLKDLLGFADDGGYKFRLSSDIDLSNDSGLYIPYFRGEFDGNYHNITNLTVDLSSVPNVGLFGYIPRHSSISNLSVKNVYIRGDDHVGGLVGWNDYGATVKNSSATGIVYGVDRNVGGLIGRNRGTIKKSFADVEVSGSSEVYRVGGFVGFQCYDIIENCYANGNVSGDRWVGGLIGLSDGGAVKKSYSTGSVSGYNYVGGLIGENTKSTVENSFWNTDTSGQSSSDGGTGKTTPEMKDVATFTDETKNGLDFAWDFVSNPNDDNGDEYVWNIDGYQNVNDGYPFLNWQDVDGLKKFKLNLSSTTGGDVIVPGEGTFEYQKGTYVDIRAISNENYSFVRWKGDDQAIENLNSNLTRIMVAKNLTIIAEFVDITPPEADAGKDKTVKIDESITFDGSNSNDNANIVNYTWTIEGSEYYGVAVDHTFEHPGDYTVTLKVTDEAGNSDTDNVVITVNDMTAPTADAGDDKTVDEDTTVTFDGSNSYDNSGIEDYEWTIEGSNYNGEIVEYSFSEPGDYLIELKVTDYSGNSDTDTVNVTINDVTSPTVKIKNPIDTVYTKSSIKVNVSVDDNANPIDTVFAEIDSDINITLNPETLTYFTKTHNFSDGQHTIKIYAKDTVGNLNSNKKITFTVDTTSPKVNIKNPNIDEDVFEVNISTSWQVNENIGIDYYKLSIDGGEWVRTDQNSYEFFNLSEGDHKIEVKAFDIGGNVGKDTVNFTVVYPDFNLDLSSTTTQIGDIVTVNGNLTWGPKDMSDKTIVFSTNVTGHVANKVTGIGGVYSFDWQLPVSGQYNCKASWKQFEQSVNLGVTTNNKEKAFTVVSNSAVQKLVFNSSSKELGFKVSGPDGTTGFVDVTIAKTIVQNASDITVYLDGEELNYTLTSKGDVWLLHFTYTHSTHSVNIGLKNVDNESPTADAGSDKTIEVGESLTLNASSSSDNVGIDNYEWDLDNGEIKIGKQITYTYDEAGSYTVKLTVEDEAGNNDTDIVEITVEENKDTTDPTADAGEDRTVDVGEEITLDASGSSDDEGIESYEWNLGNGETETGKDISYSYSEEGTYTIELTVTDGNGNTDTDNIEITVESTDDGEDKSDSSDGTPGFTLMLLLLSISIVIIYLNRKR